MKSSRNTSCFEIECAVWHSAIPASVIAQTVGLSPRIEWSAGDINASTGVARDRTYCRFSLGAYSQEQINGGLMMLAPFEMLTQSRLIEERDNNIIIYFINIGNATELYINLHSLRMVNRLKASIVFR